MKLQWRGSNLGIDADDPTVAVEALVANSNRGIVGINTQIGNNATGAFNQRFEGIVDSSVSIPRLATLPLEP